MDDLLVRTFADQWVLAVVTTVLLLVAAEIGYRFGRRLHATADDARRSQVGAIQGAVLGMTGLLLGFTFSMAVGRYDSRRDLVVQEANAIGTTWLRTDLLPEGPRQPLRKLLLDYVDIRLETQARGRDALALTEGLRRSADIQSQLWQHANAAVREAPTPITATFITALNELIDIDADRRAASRNRIPAGVWLILIVVAGFACGTSAYAAGAQGVRTSFASVLLPLLVTVVILLIFDLTHERQGIIGISQQPMIDLRDAMASSPDSR